MHEITRILLAASAPTLRAALPKAEFVVASGLSFGADVLYIAENAYRADALFSQVDAATRERVVAIEDLKGGRAELTCDASNGPIVLRREGRHIAINGLALTAPSPAHRLAELKRMLATGWLGRKAEADAQRRAKLRKFKPDEITALQVALDQTLESHLDQIRASLEQRTADYRNLVWSDRAGLERLLGPALPSTGPDFPARARKMLTDRLASKRFGALTTTLALSTGPGWTPETPPPGLDLDGLCEAACPGGRLGNPFAVAAAMELLNAGTTGDPRALQVLDLLETQFDDINDRLTVFSGALAVALASLATAATTRDAPALWRRCTAYGLAGVHTHLLQNFDTALAQAFQRDARGLYGLQADLAIARDAEHLPRWLPLMTSAEALWGHLWFRFRMLEATATHEPTRQRLEALVPRMSAQIKTSGAPLAALFPSVHEGARADIAAGPIADLVSDQLERTAAEAEDLLWPALVNCALLCPATPQMAEQAARLVIDAKPRDLIDDQEDVAYVVTAMAYLLAALKDGDSARLLVGKLMIAGATLRTNRAVIQVAHAVVVLASAQPDAAERRTALEVGLSAIAFGVETASGAQGLLHVIDTVMAMEPATAAGLAQARIAATLRADAA